MKTEYKLKKLRDNKGKYCQGRLAQAGEHLSRDLSTNTAMRNLDFSNSTTGYNGEQSLHSTCLGKRDT